ncbi:MAG: flagellar motor protein MotB [Planctomycetaceae bacterium]
MGKKLCCSDSKAGEIPSWFMTYSDVITLMMTFFILLLTFSTNEPEFFSKVQVVAFGGGGSTGRAGASDNALDQNVPIARYRPDAARKTTWGTETPPMETDHAQQTLAKGLAALEQTHLLADADRIRLLSPLSAMRDENGQPTAHGWQQVRMLAPQLINMPVELGFRATSQEDADFCINLAVTMFAELGVPLGRISVSLVEPSIVPRGHLEMMLTRQDKNSTR